MSRFEDRRDPYRWLEIGLVTYAFTVVFRRLWHLPVVEAKLQPPELIFALLGPPALLFLGRKLLPSVTLFTGGLGLYLGVLTLSASLNGDVGTYLEAAGRWYLLLLFLLVAWYVRARGRMGAERLLWAWTAGAVVMFAVAYLGYALALAGLENRFVVEYENYPYFGTVYRAASVAGGPTPVAVLALLPLVWHYRRWRTGRGGAWFLALATPILLLTFAKEVLLVGLACAWADPWLRGRKWLPWLLTINVAAFYWGVTHYLPEAPKTYAPGDLEGVVFNSGRVALRGESWQLTETSYTAIKRACVRASLENPWLGIGPDQLEHWLPRAKEAGLYPAHLPDYTPHSTWFGAVAEVGWAGLAGVALLVFGAARMVRDGLRRADDVDLALLGFCVAFFIGGMAMDLLHLRFVWLALGILVGRQSGLV